MDLYNSLLKSVIEGTALERVKVHGIPVTMSEPRPRTPSPVLQRSSGKDYVRQALEEEEDDWRASECPGRMNLVDELTSIATIPDHHELDPSAMAVYRNYDFTTQRRPHLLVHEYEDKILSEIEANSIVIIKGYPGSGKTTQIPQFVLDSSVKSNRYCNMVVTQPRKIAAVSVARRVCDERDWKIGGLIGFQVSLNRTLSNDTRLLYCTTGVLLSKLINEKSLDKFTHIFIDEVHERDLENDFLLVVVKKLIHAGCRTKLILMSATAETKKLANYFARGTDPVIVPPTVELKAASRQFKVHTFYLNDMANKVSGDINISTPGISKTMYDLAAFLVRAFQVIDKQEHEDTKFLQSVLIFLPGIHEIESMFSTLMDGRVEGETWKLCPLHSSVTAKEQMEVFRSSRPRERKIILATNIAESSITVPDVKYVIDFCLTKVLQQSPDTGYTSLQLQWASQNQMCQRAGRVGRTMAGRVYRLIPREKFEELPEHAVPEMLRSPLEAVVLKVKLLNLGSPCHILGRALDPPDLSDIVRTVLSLKQLGALKVTRRGKYVEDDGDLTYVGYVMANLPLDPVLSKIIVTSHLFCLLSEGVSMACSLSVKSIFSTPFKRQLNAYISRLDWADASHSDPIAFLGAYTLWREKTTLSAFSKAGGLDEKVWAENNFLQLQSLREVATLEAEVHDRLKAIQITEPPFKVVDWEKRLEKPLILKIILAGACYPNYFVRKPIDELEAIKVLGGRDPFSTVYLSGFPQDQPRTLYTKSIMKHFLPCGSRMKVSFDCSSKVYVEFGNSEVEREKNVTSFRMEGKIKPAVYKAVKLRLMRTLIEVAVMKPALALKRAEELGVEGIATGHWDPPKNQPHESSPLPGLTENRMKMDIHYVVSPSLFWVQNASSFWFETSDNLCRQLFDPESRVPLCTAVVEGQMVLAPFVDEGEKLYYRAIVKKKTKRDMVYVFFVDYGNEDAIPESELRDFARACESLKMVPHLAIRCTLSEVQPSLLHCVKGQWSPKAIEYFRNRVLGLETYATVFSVIGGELSLVLHYPDCIPQLNYINFTESYNAELIEKGFAEPADEPFLSRENNIARQVAVDSPESIAGGTVGYMNGNPFSMKTVNVDSPPLSECPIKVNLKGPKSPLEMTLLGLSKKSYGNSVQVDYSSVNCVLLDTQPMDSHDRMLVAGTVVLKPRGDLSLRDTTLLPNIRGLPALLTMIFAPYVELRTDERGTKLTGALCGLGYDPQTGAPYYPENDIEITFDACFSLPTDITLINKLRNAMNRALYGDVEWTSSRSRESEAKYQEKIAENLVKLLQTKRRAMERVPFQKSFKWDQIPAEARLNPMGDTYATSKSGENVYPLIWGVDLEEVPVDAVKLQENLKLLQNVALGKVSMPSSVTCDLCGTSLSTLLSLRHHLQTKMHKDNEILFLKK